MGSNWTVKRSGLANLISHVGLVWSNCFVWPCVVYDIVRMGFCGPWHRAGMHVRRWAWNCVVHDIVHDMHACYRNAWFWSSPRMHLCMPGVAQDKHVRLVLVMS